MVFKLLILALGVYIIAQFFKGLTTPQDGSSKHTKSRKKPEKFEADDVSDGEFKDLH